MAMISKEQLEKFKVLYKNRFGKEISDQEAIDGGARLIRPMEMIYKPITQEEFEALEKHRKEI
mgnify:CR=1 FL=1